MRHNANEYQQVTTNLHFIKSHSFASNFIEVTFW